MAVFCLVDDHNHLDKKCFLVEPDLERIHCDPVDDHVDLDKKCFLIESDLLEFHLDIVVDHRSKDRFEVVLFVGGCGVRLMGCLRLLVYCLKTGPII